MKFLLDTHIWLWIHREPLRLTSEVNQYIADPDNELWLSPVSIWELIILVEKNKVILREGVGKWVEKSRRELSLRDAVFSWEVAQELVSTSLGHRDPGDRFLVATSRVYDLTLITADEQLMRVPGLAVLPNR